MHQRWSERVCGGFASISIYYDELVRPQCPSLRAIDDTQELARNLVMLGPEETQANSHNVSGGEVTANTIVDRSFRYAMSHAMQVWDMVKIRPRMTPGVEQSKANKKAATICSLLQFILAMTVDSLKSCFAYVNENKVSKWRRRAMSTFKVNY